RLFVELLRSIRRLHGDALTFTDHFDALVGGETLRKRILDGGNLEDLYATWERQREAFDAARPKRYPHTRDLLDGLPPVPTA
ncbi:MAG TPA: hypothetical protein PK379_14190, partial [Candidatus Hydrogenedentes bacterium]|nr:hypothetical protein [Candidatus Hydrogenedentota bacterium]